MRVEYLEIYNERYIFEGGSMSRFTVVLPVELNKNEVKDITFAVILQELKRQHKSLDSNGEIKTVEERIGYSLEAISNASGLSIKQAVDMDLRKRVLTKVLELALGKVDRKVSIRDGVNPTYEFSLSNEAIHQFMQAYNGKEVRFEKFSLYQEMRQQRVRAVAHATLFAGGGAAAPSSMGTTAAEEYYRYQAYANAQGGGPR